MKNIKPFYFKPDECAMSNCKKPPVILETKTNQWWCREDGETRIEIEMENK